jgi:hypothetical protein
MKNDVLIRIMDAIKNFDLYERLLKEIDKENRQTKSGLKTEKVCPVRLLESVLLLTGWGAITEIKFNQTDEHYYFSFYSVQAFFITFTFL